MKRLYLSLMLAIMLLPFSGYSQSKVRYRSDYKYSLWSNMEIGFSGIYSYKFGSTHGKNVGADLRLTKRIGDYWRLRGRGEINGFIANGFDRCGKLMGGVSFDLLPFYVFGETGFVFNPSDKTICNTALEGGIGLQFKSFFVEAGFDRLNHGDHWSSNANIHAGCLIPLGMTPQDKKNQQIDEHIHAEYGELKQENQLLKSEAQKAAQNTQQQQQLLEQMQQLYAQMEAKLNECNQEKEQIKQNCISSVDALKPIYFEWGSAEVSSTYDQQLEIAAEYIKANEGTYTIKGYCSNNGNDYNNQKLSENRAWSVYQILIDYGVNSTWLVPSGYGKTEQFSDRYDISNQVVIIEKAKY